MAILEEQVFKKYRGKSVLLDSNLLLVLVSGQMGQRVFQSFKRVQDYTIADHQLLVRFLSTFKSLITTPHILTEVSNLANSLPQNYKPEWYKNFAFLIASQEKNASTFEKWIPAAELIQGPEFIAFGITDAALSRLAAEALIVTEDFRLAGFLQSQGMDVLNFHHLRKLAAANSR
ncbi:hypothetical protein [Terracidiphilus sp.]|uniref:hypothetical protein n=1 Tax=Terracidiphilus sp. TaxID=1964191 RepID=UPI003C15ED31